jgi:AcrR family transcriptional regulator
MATKAERREALVRAAIDVIAERGLGGTRVADIAERAGISPGHVLYYFDGKGRHLHARTAHGRGRPAARGARGVRGAPVGR